MKTIGLISANYMSKMFGELLDNRSLASLPYGGRYRLIDFPLSSMRNAGILNVGVIMQRDYQSLLDHLGSGKTWDMSRRVGGLRMLPPFGLPEYHTGNYSGTMEALNAVYTYIEDIKEKKNYNQVPIFCTKHPVETRRNAIESIADRRGHTGVAVASILGDETT
jgi:glucose-1-phosphate adenylyltransferase